MTPAIQGVSTAESAADFDFAYGGSIPPLPANHFPDITKMVYNLSRCEIVNDTHQEPVILYTE